MLEISSTKAFMNLACGHAQWFDVNSDGSPGACAAVHGYDRTVKLTFSGQVDEHGWLFPFGELKAVRSWLEYYFDHTTVLPADDPRIESIPEEMLQPDGVLGTLRILPYGVSMEMSSLFIWEHVNPFIKYTTAGRVYVSKVESIEHERNSAYIEADRGIADAQGRAYFNNWKLNHLYDIQYEDFLLPKSKTFAFIPPKEVLDRLNIGISLIR